MSAASASQLVSGLVRDGALHPPSRRVTARPVVVRAATATAPKPAKISDRRVGNAVVGSPAASSRHDAASVSAAPGRDGPPIPVVDLASSDEACVSVVREALFEGVGFFHVRNHGVPPEAFARLAGSAAAFFDAPVAEKRALAVGDMKLSRGYEVSPEHVAAMFSERDVSVEAERADPEPSAARRLVGERFSAGPFRRPRDAYHAGEDGAVFFAPNAWPSENRQLREHMEAYYEHMEALSNRVLRLIALAANAPPDFFIQKSDRHCSNLQVANYPTLRSGDWEAPATAPPRKKAHADSGTITILARERRHIPSTQTPDADTRRGGLQVLVGDDVWADVPTLEGGARDGAEGAALLVNVGNQLQAWSDGYWRSTKHRVTNPTYVPLDEDNTDLPSSTRRVSVAFFHKANYDAAVDAKELLAFGGFGEAAARDVAARNAPVVTAGELSRVGMLRKFAKQGMDAAQASMAYHEALMGAEAAAEAAGSSFHGGRAFKRFSNGASRKKPSPSRRDVSAGAARGDGVRCRCCPPVSGDGLGFDRGSDDRGAGLGNDNPSARCPVCKGTGWKPCGQCDGTGVNQDDLFGGKFLKGDTCWLCSGKAKTMCGNCIDLTDSF
jgi:isopenicillin N synthase-like dioxygenase